VPVDHRLSGSAQSVRAWPAGGCRRKQFAPTIVSPQTRLSNIGAWEEAVTVSLDSERNWALPVGQRRLVVPGASHFKVTHVVSSSWGNAREVATIGDHTFYRVPGLLRQRS